MTYRSDTTLEADGSKESALLTFSNNPGLGTHQMFIFRFGDSHCIHALGHSAMACTHHVRVCSVECWR